LLLLPLCLCSLCTRLAVQPYVVRSCCCCCRCGNCFRNSQVVYKHSRVPIQSHSQGIYITKYCDVLAVFAQASSRHVVMYIQPDRSQGGRIVVAVVGRSKFGGPGTAQFGGIALDHSAAAALRLCWLLAVPGAVSCDASVGTPGGTAPPHRPEGVSSSRAGGGGRWRQAEQSRGAGRVVALYKRER